MKKIKKKRPKFNKVVKTCCLCDSKIRDNQKIFALDFSIPKLDTSKKAGELFPIIISALNKTVWAIIPTLDSDARKDGKDYIFVTCSENCKKQLKELLIKELTDNQINVVTN
jgi:hypothetical protein